MAEDKKPKKPDLQEPNFFRNVFLWLLVLFLIFQLFRLGSQQYKTFMDIDQVPYGKFYQMVSTDAVKIAEAKIINDLVQGKYEDGRVFQVRIPEGDEDVIRLLRDKVPELEIIASSNAMVNFVYYLAPTVLFILFLWFFAYRGAKIGDKIWAFGKARPKLINQFNGKKITFKDVAGVDEAKEELQEVIEFLKDPRRFQRLGGKIPKGVLLVGPPGVGKTLLAKAVSGEANVPFFSLSGSDFVELFVGVGASRVRDLFEQAKKASKVSGGGCIIFIDELDAVGRQRFAGIGGGHDEREQTLNQLLVEMDGFDPNEGIILMAATNRPDVLDPALLRPGRFDRHIVVDLPDIKGREQILKVHVNVIKISKDIALSEVAKQTPGFSGADLANLCNEAALLAARKNKEAVTMVEVEEAIERVIAGPQRKSKVITAKEKEIVAYHEAGHALMCVLFPGATPLHKVTIIPRGMSMGYTSHFPKEQKYLKTKSEYLAELAVSLGGRAAEELTFKEFTSGSHNDLMYATKIARMMVAELGMNERLGNVVWERKAGPVFLGRDLVEKREYSEEIARAIDEEVKDLVENTYRQVKSMLQENLDKLKSLTAVLLEKETLDAQEVNVIIGIKDEKKTDSE